MLLAYLHEEGMMAKQYFFRHPDQLKEISSLCKDDPSQIVNTARIWSVITRQGKTTWDGKIGISFFTQGTARKACVFRLGMDNQRHALGGLKYNAALKWCEEHLQTAE